MGQNNIIESFHQGHCVDAYKLFGAHFSFEGGQGVRFTVWAPHARKVSVIGSFNNWNGEYAVMEKVNVIGVFSLFIKGVKEWESYKYRIEDAKGNIIDKADPFAFFSEYRPNTASVVYNPDNIKWKDTKWMKERTKGFDAAVNIYEVYAGGWKKHEDGDYSYEDLKNELIPYVKEHGFTHIEFMPLTEYPFDGSWGYQASGYYSCTSRYGNPSEFADFVNECHKQKIGVIMDMVPVHFVKDAHGLRYFDGQPLFEYENPNDANSQWSTMNFNLWKEEVRSFLISSACFWCDVYHIDGIRMDAVSHLIFWDGDKRRGTNDGALAFIRRMNYYLNRDYPGVMLIAEDSSDYPKVTKSTIDMGLGFDYKWDLGWMNDTLRYYREDPIYRKWDHNKLTFSMAYFYSENFMMPLSHDEVVHGKHTIVDQMWGLYGEKLAQAKNLYIYMMCHPGKKLNFMGNEFAMFREFDESRELDWDLLEYPIHDSFLRFFTDLNKIYQTHPAMYKEDYGMNGFKWLNADDADHSVYTFYRTDGKEYIVCVFNMTPIAYESFEIGLPQKGIYTEIMNSEKDIYSGCNMCNFEPIKSLVNKDAINPNYINNMIIRLAPYAGIMFTCPVKKETTKKTTAKKETTKKTTTKKTTSTTSKTKKGKK